MEVYSSHQPWAAYMLRDLLEAEGIRAHVRESFGAYHRRNDHIVYLVDPADETRARAVVSGFTEHASDAAPDARAVWPWRCRTCGEEGEPQFTQCWNCGAERETRR